MDISRKMPVNPGLVLQSGRRPGLNQTALPCRVWLVDDDRELRHFFAELLGRMRGLDRPREFHSPDILLVALERETPPDVVLLDIQMGEKDGLDYIKPIRELAPETSVLMFTTFYDASRESRAFKEGAAGFVLKSESIESIVAQILTARSLPKGAGDQARTVQRLGQSFEDSGASTQSLQE